MDFCTGGPAAGAICCAEVVWPTDVSTLDVDAMVVRETTHRFQPLILSPGNGRATFTAPETAWPDLAGLCPEQERKGINRMLSPAPVMTINWHENR